MSINDDEWYYGENSQKSVPWIDISRIMQGDGFDEENNPFRRPEEYDAGLVGQKIEPCQCDVKKLRKAVEDLQKALQKRPQMFPVHENQFDSFAQVGGYAGGFWHKFIDISGSRIETRDENGFIKLGSNCAVRGHSCKIIKTGEDEFVIVGLSENTPDDDRAESSLEPDLRGDDQNGKDIDDEYERYAVLDDEESDEEAKMYDERTFGDLDETSSRFDEDPLTMTPDMWRSSAFSDEKVVEYIAALLEPRDIAYLSRFMPPDEISEWIAEFNEDSLEAAQMLDVALGGLHHVDDANPDSFDSAVTRLTRDIRAVVKKHFAKYKKDVSVNEFKIRSDRENYRR
jgi:hypothetical protein